MYIPPDLCVSGPLRSLYIIINATSICIYIYSAHIAISGVRASAKNINNKQSHEGEII